MNSQPRKVGLVAIAIVRGGLFGGDLLRTTAATSAVPPDCGWRFLAVSLSGSLVRGEVAGGPFADFIDQFDRRTPVEGLGVK